MQSEDNKNSGFLNEGMMFSQRLDQEMHEFL
jgi:hypothetical protein